MSSVDPGLSVDVRRHFLHALQRVLRPIIRLMIRNGIGYGEFADVARGAFIESAIRNAVNDGAKLTREQVAQLTGIPRQRVDHYIDDPGALPTASPTPTHVISEVLHKWHTDPRYLGPEGGPLELEFDGSSEPTFKGLVAQVDIEANPDLVIDDLLKTKSVVYSDERRLHVVTRSFIWPGEWPHGIEYFGTALAHLIQTHEYNFNPENAEHKRLERFVSADQGLPARLLPGFQAFAKECADQFLFDLDDWLAHFSDTTINQVEPRAAAGVNVFLYVEPPPDPGNLSTLVQPERDPAAAADEPVS